MVQHYNHTQNGGTIPTATWNISSDCNITGIIATEPSGLEQTFWNINWNCPGQNDEILLYWLATGGSVAGDFTVISTGSGFLRISSSSSPTLSVGGDFNIAGGTFYGSIGSGDPTIDIGGDLNISSGTFNLSSASGNVTVNLSGALNLTGGTLSKSGSGTGTIYFENTGATQNFRHSAGTISGAVNFTVNSGVTIDFGASDVANGSGTFTLSNGATFRQQTHQVSMAQYKHQADLFLLQQITHLTGQQHKSQVLIYLPL